MSLKINGTIEKVLPIQKGETKAGAEWQKMAFTVKTSEQYNNLYCFELFGEEKINNFNQYHKVGKAVEVEFNVNTNEWQGKYFTTLSAWKVSTDTNVENVEVQQPIFETVDTTVEPENDLPF